MRLLLLCLAVPVFAQRLAEVFLLRGARAKAREHAAFVLTKEPHNLQAVAVLGGDIDVGLDVRKILQAPGIGFVDRHEPERGESGNNGVKGTPPPSPF